MYFSRAFEIPVLDLGVLLCWLLKTLVEDFKTMQNAAAQSGDSSSATDDAIETDFSKP